MCSRSTVAFRLKDWAVFFLPNFKKKTIYYVLSRTKFHDKFVLKWSLKFSSYLVFVMRIEILTVMLSKSVIT